VSLVTAFFGEFRGSDAVITVWSRKVAGKRGASRIWPLSCVFSAVYEDLTLWTRARNVLLVREGTGCRNAAPASRKDSHGDLGPDHGAERVD
jgi:hypothetical protein